MLISYNPTIRPQLAYYAVVKTRLDGETRHRLVASMGVMAAQQTAWESELVEVRERLVRDAR